MSTDQKLENYLEQLNKSLDQIPISDRADIITEIKSHILEARERDPSQSLSGILASLGEPESVASKYLLERGLSPNKPSKTPMVKWLVIGFLGTVGMLLVTAMFVVWKFTPLISIGGENDSISILGGAINIGGATGADFTGSDTDESVQGSHTYSKSHERTRGKIDIFKLKFNNGKVSVKPSTNDKFGWDCKHADQAKLLPMSEEGKTVSVDVSGIRKIDCEVKILQGMVVEVEGNNGKISLEELRTSASVNLVNGKVEISPAKEVDYVYDLRIKNGWQDSFASSNAKGAHKINVALVNGKISKE